MAKLKPKFDFSLITDEVLSSLTIREQEVIKLFYLENKDVFEIGKYFEVTRERARQLIHNAEKKIKRKIKQ